MTRYGWLLLMVLCAATRVHAVLLPGELPHKAVDLAVKLISTDAGQLVGYATIDATDGLVADSPVIALASLEAVPANGASYRVVMCTLAKDFIGTTPPGTCLGTAVQPGLSNSLTNCAFPQVQRLDLGESRGFPLLGYFTPTTTSLTVSVWCEANNSTAGSTKGINISGRLFLWQTRSDASVLTPLTLSYRNTLTNPAPPGGDAGNAVLFTNQTGTITTPTAGMYAAVWAVATGYTTSDISGTATDWYGVVTATSLASPAHTITPEFITGRERMGSGDISVMALIGRFSFPACTGVGNDCKYTMAFKQWASPTTNIYGRLATFVVMPLTSDDGLTTYPSAGDATTLSTDLVGPLASEPSWSALRSGTMYIKPSAVSTIMVGGSSTQFPFEGSTDRAWDLSVTAGGTQIDTLFAGGMDAGSASNYNTGAFMRMATLTPAIVASTPVAAVALRGAIAAAQTPKVKTVFRSMLGWSLVPWPGPGNTSTPANTATPVNTETPANTFTDTQTPTETRTPTITYTPTETRTPTQTRTFTPSRTSTNTPTETMTPTITRTPGECTVQDSMGEFSLLGQCPLPDGAFNGVLLLEQSNEDDVDDNPQRPHHGQIVGDVIRRISNQNQIPYLPAPPVQELTHGVTMVTDLDGQAVNIDQNPGYEQVPSESLMHSAGACTVSHPCRVYPYQFRCGSVELKLPITLNGDSYYCSLYGGPPTSVDNAESRRGTRCTVTRMTAQVADVNGNLGSTAWLPAGCALIYGLIANGTYMGVSAILPGEPGEDSFAPASGVLWEVDQQVAIVVGAYGSCPDDTNNSGYQERMLYGEITCTDD